MIGVTEEMLREMTEAIAAEVAPERIYLFGSCAQGHVTADSDVDLLVVESEAFGPEHSRWRELKRIRKALGRFRVPKDILVYSRDEVARWEGSANHIVAHCLRQGRLVYERP